MAREVAGGTYVPLSPTLVELPGAARRTASARLLQRLWQLRTGTGGGVVILALAVLALFPGFFAPLDAYKGTIVDRLLPPIWMDGGSNAHLLGTDAIGRDILSRLIYGARVSLAVGLVASVLSAAVGVVLGLGAGYFGHYADVVISTGINVMLTLPFILLALAAVAVLGASFWNLIIVLGLAGWPLYSRVVRAEVLQLKEMDFVQSARVVGAGHLRIIARHIMVNVVGSIIVLATVQVARVIITEAFLSFLGLGIQPPTPAWGSMLGESRQFMYDKWWLPTFPGLAIFVTTLAFNLFGDGLRDWFDPYARNR